MKNRKAVSVALATYNGEAFLPEQLASLAGQEHLPAELVITDDGSTDGTEDCVRHFARTAPFPVQFYRNPVRLGYRENFMKAASLCRSELVAFCDQDDVWDGRKLAIAAEAFEAPDTLLFFHDAWLISRAGECLGPASIYTLPPRSAPLSAHSMFQPFGFTIVFSRSLLQFSELRQLSADSNKPDTPMAHDQWVFFLASIFGWITYSEEKLANYRQHGSNTFGRRVQDWRSLLQHWMRWRTNNGARYAELARAARSRVAVLAESKGMLSGPWLARAVRGEDACARLAERLAQRARLYEASSLVERAALVAKLYRGGAYAQDNGFGLGREVMVKDAVFGILLQRFLYPLDQQVSA